MIKFQFFPRSQGITSEIESIVNCFRSVDSEIGSATKNLSSDKVLAKLRFGLETLGFRVESGKSKDKKIGVPVLFGLDNKIDKYFNADALSADGRIVIEVEAGR